MGATGKRIDVEVMDLLRVSGARLVEQWALTERLGMLKQIGAVQA